MEFKLRINFMCLCFFVPDRQRGEVHVLMPSTCRHATDADEIEPHLVSLMFPSAGGTLDALGHEVAQGQGENDFIDMKGWTLVLGEKGTPANRRLSSRIPDVTPLAGRVDPSLLGPDPGPKIASRVTLASGALKKTHPAARWRFNGREVAIAQRIVWEMTLPGDRLEWSRTRIADGHEEPLPTILPTGGVVKLEIHHTTPECFPVPQELPALSSDVIAKHFGAFFTLFPLRRDPPRVPLLPEFIEPVEEDLPLSCMAGQGRPK
jgi:hypothetical protein